MDLKLKFGLVAVAGVVAGMLLLGSALAIPAAFHHFAGGQFVTDGQGYGPGMMGRGGMMGERGFNNDDDAPYYQGGPGMMGPRGPRDGRGFDGDGGYYQNGTCPRTQDTTQSAL